MIGKNNPLNIRYSPLNNWLGQSGQTKGFCDFQNVAYCIRAVGYLLMISYRKKGALTYAQLIERFAPGSENPSGYYIAFVCDKCNVFPWDCPEDYFDFANMIYYMWRFEQGEWPNSYLRKINFILTVSFEKRHINSGNISIIKYYPIKLNDYEKKIYFDLF